MRSELDKLCEKHNVCIDAQYGGVELPPGWPRDAHPYRVTLRMGRRRLTTPFYQGSAHTKGPMAADVLYCLCFEARAGEQTFENFCGDFGYDTDSRQAERNYNECRKMAPRVRRFLGDLFDTFCNAEH